MVVFALFVLLVVGLNISSMAGVKSLNFCSMDSVKSLNFLGVLGVKCLNSLVMRAIKYLNLVSKSFVLCFDFLAQIELALLESLVETSHFRVVSSVQVVYLS